MGCHTFVYIKLSALSEEQKNKIVQNKTRELEDCWMLNTPFEDIVKELEELDEEDAVLILNGKTPECYAQESIKKLKHRVHDLRNRGFNAEDIQNPEYNTKLKIVGNEKYYYLSFDAPFRMYGYPTEVFTNKDELLQWLKDNPQLYYGFYNDDNKFIKGYTPELVQRINDFFEKYNKNNEDVLYINFG